MEIENNTDLEDAVNINTLSGIQNIIPQNYQSTLSQVEKSILIRQDEFLSRHDSTVFVQVDADTLIVAENVTDSVVNEPEPMDTNKTVPIQVIRGFLNNDNVSCYANSVVQVLFHCEQLVTEIYNNQLGPALHHCLQKYYVENTVHQTTVIREYLSDDIYAYTDLQQQDCVQFLESLINRHRTTFDTLFGFQELCTNRCDLCDHTTYISGPRSLIKHVGIPQDRRQTLQQLLQYDQNTWSHIPEFRCMNCNETGGYKRKCAMTSPNEYVNHSVEIVYNK